MSNDAEKAWNDKARAGRGRVSRARRAARQEARRAAAPERSEGNGYKVEAPAAAVKPKRRARKSTSGRDD